MTKSSDFCVAIFHFCTNVFRAIFGKKKSFPVFLSSKKFQFLRNQEIGGKRKQDQKKEM
jgi:hypothetical protein